MNLRALNTRSRQFLRDTGKTIFGDNEILSGINEAVDRIRNIPALVNMKYLEDDGDIPAYLPEQYHHLIAIYSASRCFMQDEQLQQATMLMNEFEAKLGEFRTALENGDITIKDPDGNDVDLSEFNKIDYIQDIYFKNTSTNDDVGF